VDDVTHEGAFHLVKLLADFLDTGRHKKRSGIVAAGRPFFGLPSAVARCTLADLFDGGVRNAVAKSIEVDKFGVEVFVRGSVGDAPGADVFIEILFAIDRTRVDESPALVAAFAFLLGLDKAAAADWSIFRFDYTLRILKYPLDN
jgi:hypothetical protein